jgi:uncharacterized membrane protein
MGRMSDDSGNTGYSGGPDGFRPDEIGSDDIRVAAKKRLKAKRDFRTYLGIWAAVTVLLVAIWFFSGATSYFWPIWPFLGMGIGAFFAGLDAYGPGRRRITEAEIDAEVRRMTGPDGTGKEKWRTSEQ